VLIPLAAFAIAVSTPIAAESVSLGALAGNWVIETAPHQNSGCVIRGDAVARVERGALAIALNAHETCPDGTDARAVEQCRGNLSAQTLQVRCVLQRSTSDTYIADHFVLTVVGSNAMVGRLVDGRAWNEPATWRRPSAPMIS